MRGNETMGLLPRNVFKSDPHMPTMRTRSRISPGFGDGSGTSLISVLPGLLMTSALIGRFEKRWRRRLVLAGVAWRSGRPRGGSSSVTGLNHVDEHSLLYQ